MLEERSYKYVNAASTTAVMDSLVEGQIMQAFWKSAESTATGELRERW